MLRLGGKMEIIANYRGIQRPQTSTRNIFAMKVIRGGLMGR